MTRDSDSPADRVPPAPLPGPGPTVRVSRPPGPARARGRRPGRRPGPAGLPVRLLSRAPSRGLFRLGGRRVTGDSESLTSRLPGAARAGHGRFQVRVTSLITVTSNPSQAKSGPTVLSTSKALGDTPPLARGPAGPAPAAAAAAGGPWHSGWPPQCPSLAPHPPSDSEAAALFR